MVPLALRRRACGWNRWLAIRSSSSSSGSRAMWIHPNAAFAFSSFQVYQSFVPVQNNIPPCRRRNNQTVRYFADRKNVAREEDDENDLYLVAASTTATTSVDDSTSNSLSSSFATSYHAPVMWNECIEALTQSQSQREFDDTDYETSLSSERIKQSRIYVDGTLGGGGHSQAILQALSPGDVLFGCDVDPDALSVASQRLSSYLLDNSSTGPWFIPVQSNFADLASNVLLEQVPKSVTIAHKLGSHLTVDGILLDLGVSSYQIDTAERGFAFMKDGPLDMRMNARTGQITAANLCNELDVVELRRIFSVYGDEPRARVIAESIVERRPLSTTGDLQAAVANVTPQFARKGRRLGRMATMARVFQSLRIVVNHEDVVLERALTKMAPNLLAKGGRLVVLSYHSIEDRATKRVIRDGTVSKREANRNNEQKDVYGNYIGSPKPFRVVGKPQKASAEEVALNARARSATLRVAERL